MSYLFNCFSCSPNLDLDGDGDSELGEPDLPKIKIVLSEMEYFVAMIYIITKNGTMLVDEYTNNQQIQSILDLWFDDWLYPNKKLETYLYNLGPTENLEDHLKSITFSSGNIYPISYDMY